MLNLKGKQYTYNEPSNGDEILSKLNIFNFIVLKYACIFYVGCCSIVAGIPFSEFDLRWP